MKIALAADWLPTYGGAEHVIAAMHQLWPSAPIYTTLAKRGSIGALNDAEIATSSLQNWYIFFGKHRMLLPWMPRAMERFDFSGFDVIVSSSHAIGKGIIPPSSACHICYCHTPMRYAWEMEDVYLHDFGITGPLKKIAKKTLRKLRRWDLCTARRVDHFLANSSETARRIQEIYGREATVIHPPVEDHFFAISMERPASTNHYFLAVGRLVPYKRFDLLIELANAQKLPLKIVGRGHDEKRLKKMAGPTVEFLGFVKDEELSTIYRNASALLFPQLEDAGVVPLEAQACGTPVIALGKGGALDTIVDGTTGLFFAEQTQESLENAISRFKAMTFDRAVIRKHAEQFSLVRFKERLAQEIGTHMKT
jgi:glycosyltransferase involved in cell wall biosynthesis